jgi:hypothetical protein
MTGITERLGASDFFRAKFRPAGAAAAALGHGDPDHGTRKMDSDSPACRADPAAGLAGGSRPVAGYLLRAYS